MKKIIIIGALSLGAIVMSTPAVFAHEDHTAVLDELVVYGRSVPTIGASQSASEGLVGYQDIKLPPLLRVGELAEAVPGMVATQHSGTGKANQYYLRGFNLDHGTDFSASAEGVPLNMRSHGHGQGYLDLNFLIPELVRTTQYRKGPYSAQVGDFSSAGSMNFNFYDRLDESMAELSVGEFGFRRALLATSFDLGQNNGVITGAIDAGTYAGPWDLDEDLGQTKAFLSYAFGDEDFRGKVTFQGYWSDWNSTDQVPLRAVQQGLITELGFIDPDLGGRTDRVALTGRFDFGELRTNVYFVEYDFGLFSNFTYELEDSVNGDEFEQIDKRRIYGGNVGGQRERTLFNKPVEIRWGAEFRYDDIGEVGLFQTTARRRIDQIRLDAVDQWSVGLFGETEIRLTDALRATVGARIDRFQWDVNASNPLNSGSGNDHQISPKLALAYRVSDRVETYLNFGRGMHSNDVRGVEGRIDPATGEALTPAEALVPSTGGEIGLRWENGEASNLTLVAFWLDLDSELVFVGDAGGTEAVDGSRRRGIEASGFWQLNDWLAMNAAYTFTDAEFRDLPDDVSYIPGAIESNFTLGLNAIWENGLNASVRLRYLGEAPLIEDNSVRADSSTLMNVGVGYRRGPFDLRLEAFNALDSDDFDIAYFYESRLPGEAAGVEDVHFHPLEPRSIRASLRFYW